MIVKDNHATLRTKIESVFAAPGLYEAEFDCFEDIHRAHGRTETRRLSCTYDLPRHFTGFAGVRQVFRLEREVLHNKSGKQTFEIVYGITSLPRLLANAKQLNELIRGHWTIENRVHYVRDVTMGEDASQVRVGNIPQVMVAFRNVALTLLRCEGYQNIAKARRYFAANPKQALKLIGITE
jgi:predicted transposase YbfD/YdcC